MDENKYVCEPHYDDKGNFDYWNPLFPYKRDTCKVRQSYFDDDDELSELMEGIAFSPEDTVACICDTCKHDWRYDRGIRPNYCPNCGAKVVD